MPPRIVATRPKVATASANHWPAPLRATVADACQNGSVEHQRARAQTPRTRRRPARPRRRRASRHGELAAQREDEAHRRIEVRARNRPEHRDQHDQDRAGRDRVAEQRDGDVPAGQRSAMMPEPTTVASRRPVPSAFGASRRRARRVTAHVRRAPPSVAADLAAAAAERQPVERRDRQGERAARCGCASIGRRPAKASRLSASVPSAAAGSGMPQCAVIGCPGQTGHSSPAAWSQTVKTKSIARRVRAANSSQLFERAKPVS